MAADLGGTLRLKAKNWASFQHYKDRSPKWIKLHKSTLDDYEFQRLPVASRALAPMLWLLASEYMDGIIVASTDEISFRMRTPNGELIEALTPLIESQFFTLEQVASNPLAKMERDAIPEKRRVEEEESKSALYVFAIAQSHPKLSHLRNEMEIPRAVVDEIIRAIGSDGAEKVLEGTKAYARSLDDPKFASKPWDFFHEFQYRQDFTPKPRQSAARRALDEAIS